MKTINYEIKDGDEGIRTTVGHMARLIRRDAQNPKIIAKAKELKGKDDLSTIKNIFTYVHKNYKYKHDPSDREVVAAPIRLYECVESENCQLPEWAGQDCDDLTVLCCALYEAAGYKTLIKIIDWKTSGEGFTHVYPMVYVPSMKKYIPTDPVAKTKGWMWEKLPVNRYETYTIDGKLYKKGSKSGLSNDLAFTSTHSQVRGEKSLLQTLNEHSGLIAATAAVVSAIWLIYYKDK